MNVETFDVNEQLLTVTPAAAEHFRSNLAAGGCPAVRISVQESGCTGYKYVIEATDTRRDDDLTVTLDNGVEIVLDATSIAFLRGTEIDYILQGINRTLTFNNPNITAECGCGESFSVG